MKVVYARTSIDSDHDQVKTLYIGYSDDVSVFLNGRFSFVAEARRISATPGSLASSIRKTTPSIFH